jgi:hypothetical protein
MFKSSYFSYFAQIARADRETPAKELKVLAE